MEYKAMLTKELLGKAIAEAIQKKGVSQVEVARHFGVKAPSVTDWIKRGTIDKAKLPALWAYFSDVVGANHWGLESFPGAHSVREPQRASYKVDRIPTQLEELRDLWDRMSEEGQNEILTMARIMVQMKPKAAPRRKQRA